MAAPEEPTPATNNINNNDNNPQLEPTAFPQELTPPFGPQQQDPTIPPISELGRRNIDIRSTFQEIRETIQPDNPKGFFLWEFLKGFYNNTVAWRVFRGFLTLLVAYKLAYEFEFVGSLKDYWEFDWGNVRDYFYSEDY